MKRALLVGINAYPGIPLSGCEKDVKTMESLLSRHGDEDCSVNFECKTLVATGTRMKTVTRASLRAAVKALFANHADSALFYFSGHGFTSALGGYLVTQDYCGDDEGLPMQEVLCLANNALLNGVVREAILILDCCFSGNLGGIKELKEHTAMLAEGLTILAASREYQPSWELAGGVFTNLLAAALSGGAANVLGEVTLAAAYAFVENQLGAWEQRPLYKCNVAHSSILRYVKPAIDLPTLRKIRKYFPTPDLEYRLDASYEEDKHHVPEGKRQRNTKHEAIMEDFRRYATENLLAPIGEEYLYWAAVRDKSCRLTETGKYVWRLADKGMMGNR